MNYLVIDLDAGKVDGYYRQRSDADRVAQYARDTGAQSVMVAAVADDDQVHLRPEHIFDRSDLPKPPYAHEEAMQRFREIAEKRRAEATDCNAE